MSPDLEAIADRVVATLEAAGLPALAEEARRQRLRLRDPVCTVVVLGEFKRGKSTLVNALVGRAVLPAGVLPVTAVVTVVDGSGEAAPAARVRYRDGRVVEAPVESIADYVSEAGNPGNASGVAECHVRVPGEHPAGIRFVDTPGLSSPFADTERATEQALGGADVGLVVLAADQAAGRVELELLERVAATLPEVLVVVNRLDAIPEAERQGVVEFVTAQAHRATGRRLPAYGVSARSALAGADDEWTARMAALRTVLQHAAAELPPAHRATAVRRALQRLLTEATAHVTVRDRSPALRRQMQDAVAERRARGLAITLFLGRERLEEATRAAADGILDALRRARATGTERELLRRAAADAAMHTVAADPGQAARQALAGALEGWSAAETAVLPEAVATAETTLTTALRHVLAEAANVGEPDSLDAAIHLAPPPRCPLDEVPAPRGRLARLGRHRLVRRTVAQVDALVDAAIAARWEGIGANVRRAVEDARQRLLAQVQASTPDDPVPMSVGAGSLPELRALHAALTA